MDVWYVPYRESLEARRLTTTQPALGLQHLRPDDTMIVLLHRLEASFRCSQDLGSAFQAEESLAKRSSFYMVATNVESQH